MIVYSRVMNGMINTTALEPYTANTEYDFWFEHDSEVEYSPGDRYVAPGAITPMLPKLPSNWGATSMDGEPLTFIANTA